MLWRRRIRQVHRWLGLLILIQLLFWVAGGFTMAFLDLDTVRGTHRAAERAPIDLRKTGELLSPSALLAEQDVDIEGMELALWMGRAVYRLDAGNSDRLIDARSGARLDPIDEAQALAVARQDYDGDSQAARAQWVETPHYETRGRTLPLWRVDMDDDLDTHIYVSPSTGEVVARRNVLWRIFDFVWMLHIMDYDERDDFNHPLLVVTAATALLFVLSGLWMLVLAFRR